MNREALVPAFSGRPSTPEEVGLLNSIIAEIGDAQDALSASIAVLRRVCEATGWVLGQMWIPSQDGTALERDAVWASESDKGLQEFVSISGRITFSLGQGFLGRVWSSKQPVWIPNVSIDRDVVRFSEAQIANFVTALGIPVVVSPEPARDAAHLARMIDRDVSAEPDGAVRCHPARTAPISCSSPGTSWAGAIPASRWRNFPNAAGAGLVLASGNLEACEKAARQGGVADRRRRGCRSRRCQWRAARLCGGLTGLFVAISLEISAWCSAMPGPSKV